MIKRTETTDSLKRPILTDPDLSAASAGVRDPIGCRVAILSYGELLGWPDLQVGWLRLKGGEAGWSQELDRAQPLWLGVAWGKIEDLEHERQLDLREAEEERQREREKIHMPIIPWTETVSLEAGDYPALITEITEEEGDFGKQLRFQFVVLDEEEQRTKDEIRAWCSYKWGPKAKLYEWGRSILGKRCPGLGEQVNTDHMLNRKVDIRVEDAVNKAGLAVTKVAGVYPYRTISKAAEADDKDLPF